HHLVIDGVSWHILAEELETGCRQLLRGEPLELPPVPTAFSLWAERLARHARSGACDGELARWRSRPAAPPPLPKDSPGAATPHAAVRTLTVSLDAGETKALLQEVPSFYRARIEDLLIAALLRSFRGWTGGRRILVELEGHGREELFEGIDLSRTVGWLTTLT